MGNGNLKYKAHTWRRGQIKHEQFRSAGRGHAGIDASAVDDPHAIVAVNLKRCAAKTNTAFR